MHRENGKVFEKAFFRKIIANIIPKNSSTEQHKIFK